MSLVANLTRVRLPDGVVALNEHGIVLVADAGEGLVWSLDIFSGSYTVAIESELFKATNKLLPLGVDGIRILGDWLYFTNPSSNFLGRVAIDEHGNAAGPVEIVANMTFPDDFALASDGTAYVGGANTLYRVSPSGKVETLAGGVNNTVLEGATSVQFGRTRDDADVVYISE